jgi:leucyl aminopeptidase (aminopeptidase T)
VSTDQLELLEGARNLVRYAEIRAGHQVLIHVEPGSEAERGSDDPVVIEALRTAVTEVGARASIMMTPPWHKTQDATPPVFEAALHGADFVIGQGEYLYTKNHYLQVAMFERGLVYIENEAKTADALSSSYGRFPAELMFAIGTAVVDRVARARIARVTTPAGTDVSMRIRPETVGGYCYPYRQDSPGYKKGFPGGTACFHPEDPVEGVIMAEAFAPFLPLSDLICSPPLRLVYRDHRAVEISGGGAEWLLEFWKRRGDENSSWLAECMWGVHPRAGGHGTRDASNPHLLHFGLGNSIPYGGPTFSKTWIVLFMQDATVTLDGEAILDRGHLTVLDAPEVREMASRYGDPDELLAEVPVTIQDAFGSHRHG